MARCSVDELPRSRGACAPLEGDRDRDTHPGDVHDRIRRAVSGPRLLRFINANAGQLPEHVHRASIETAGLNFHA